MDFFGRYSRGCVKHPRFLLGAETVKILENKYVVIGVTAVVAYALVAYFQRNVMPVPLVANYLPR